MGSCKAIKGTHPRCLWGEWFLHFDSTSRTKWFSWAFHTKISWCRQSVVSYAWQPPILPRKLKPAPPLIQGSAARKSDFSFHFSYWELVFRFFPSLIPHTQKNNTLLGGDFWRPQFSFTLSRNSTIALGKHRIANPRTLIKRPRTDTDPNGQIFEGLSALALHCPDTPRKKT